MILATHNLWRNRLTKGQLLTYPPFGFCHGSHSITPVIYKRRGCHSGGFQTLDTLTFPVKISVTLPASQTISTSCSFNGMIHSHVNFKKHLSWRGVKTNLWRGESAEGPQLLSPGCVQCTWVSRLSRRGRALIFVVGATTPQWLSKNTICHSFKDLLPGSPRTDSPPVPGGSGNLASTRHLSLLPANWLWGSRWPTLHWVAFVNLESGLPLIIDQPWPSQLACSFADSLP